MERGGVILSLRSLKTLFRKNIKNHKAINKSSKEFNLVLSDFIREMWSF